ncbi:MAG: hypothetical protein NT096_00070 [Proteobacteria bacterium]|nr:hypothetical protein [Pseudomonadota bacterium]
METTTYTKPIDILDQEIMDTLGGMEPLRAVVDAGDLTDEQYDKLFNLLQTEMPYGTQKARTGDPHEWIMHKLLNLESRLILNGM